MIGAVIMPAAARVEAGMVHFREDDAWILPLQPDLYGGDGQMLEPFLRHCLRKGRWAEILATSHLVPAGAAEGVVYFDDFSPLATIVHKAGVDSFLLEFYREAGDEVTEHCYLAVGQGLVVPGASHWPDGPPRVANEPRDFRGRLGLQKNWLGNERRYFNYRTAEVDYAYGKSRRGSR